MVENHPEILLPLNDSNRADKHCFRVLDLPLAAVPQPLHAVIRLQGYGTTPAYTSQRDLHG